MDRNNLALTLPEMNEIQILSLPYEEIGTLNLVVSAKGAGYSGFAEIYVNPQSLRNFATGLIGFPTNIKDSVIFEYGDESGEFAYYLRLQAEVIDHVGHSAILVNVSSFAGVQEAASAEFRVLSEVAAINDFGRAITCWLNDPSEPLVWRPKA